MKYTRNIFAVSIMALMAVSTARAEIVATTLLDERLGTPGTLATVASTGSYADLKNKPTVPTNTNQLTNGAGFITSAAISGKEDSANKVTDTAGYNTDITSTSKYPSMAVANEMAKSAASSAVSSKVNTNQGTNQANKVLTTNAQGVVVPGTVSSAMITDGTITTTDISATAGITKGQLATAVQTSLGKADSALQAVPVATTTAVGGVKSGGNITVAEGGAVTVNQAAKATSDGSGNNIVNTYATKAQLNDLDSTSTGSGFVVTAVSQTNGKVSVTKGNVQIPVGGASGTTYATIWVE